MDHRGSRRQVQHKLEYIEEYSTVSTTIMDLGIATSHLVIREFLAVVLAGFGNE